MRKVIFSKFPDGRAKRFSLQTNIVKDNNGLYVEKTPMYEEAVFHIENIKKKKKYVMDMLNHLVIISI